MSTEVTVRQLNRETFKVLEIVEKEGGVVITRGGEERYELTRHGDMTKEVGKDMTTVAKEFSTRMEGLVKESVEKKQIELCKHGMKKGLCKHGCK